MRIKRFLCVLLAAAFVAVIPAFRAARAEGFDYESIPTPHILVVDGNDVSKVFYARAADERAFPASTTKIMTCILALESGKLDDQVTVGEEISPFTNISSLMGLQYGETVTLRDLVYGLMLPSGNDAGATIAVYLGGGIDGFVKMMNDKAAELGMTGTHYRNPHGTQDDDHYTTARDLATLMAYAMKNEAFREVDKTTSYTVPASNVRSEPLELKTTNRLLRAVSGDPVDTVYPYAVGGKTGDTYAAGKCFVAVAERDGAKVIVVLLGDKVEMYGNDETTNNLARFVNAKAIFEYIFDNEYQTMSAADLQLPTSFSLEIPNTREEDLVDGGVPASADVSGVTIRAVTEKILAYKNNASSIQAETSLLSGMTGPVYEGMAVGSVRYTLNGDELFTVPLTATKEIREAAAAAAAEPTIPEGSDGTTTDSPLIDRKHTEWNSSNVLLLVFILLIVLLVALVAVFIINERKRRYERKRRAARARKRRRYE